MQRAAKTANPLIMANVSSPRLDMGTSRNRLPSRRPRKIGRFHKVSQWGNWINPAALIHTRPGPGYATSPTAVSSAKAAPETS
jgi:hypothetical protein